MCRFPWPIPGVSYHFALLPLQEPVWPLPVPRRPVAADYGIVFPISPVFGW